MKRTEQEILEAIDKAHARAEERRVYYKNCRQQLRGILQRYPYIKFVHLRAYAGKASGLAAFGGATLAYAAPDLGNSVVYVSVALCNVTDRYDNMLGRYHAASAYAENRVIPVRVPKTVSVQELNDFLYNKFDFLA